MHWIKKAVFLLVPGLLLGGSVRAEDFTVETPAGPVTISLDHAGPGGTLVQGGAPSSPAFRPPSIFSAPLPSGSGARALGLAGAFTAVADDATAASWNPAGLIQLERPEASIMVRSSRERNENNSDSDAFIVGVNEYGNENLNYFSCAYPVTLFNRNVVFALNYQEAYDFTQEFTATAKEGARPAAGGKTETRVDTATQVDRFDSVLEEGVTASVTFTTRLTTRHTSALQEILRSDLLTGLDFEQQGIIDAVTPAMAVEILPNLAAGLSLNLYQDSPMPNRDIRSKTTARYTGSSTLDSARRDTRVTSSTYEYEGVIRYPPPFPEIPFSSSGAFPDFSERSFSEDSSGIVVDGVYEEENRIDDLCGFNATLGFLWTVSRHLSLGGAADLPWTADAEQTKTIRDTATTYNAARTRVLDVTSTESLVSKDVEFTFPAAFALGAVWRWTDRLYTSLDVNHTRWSDFAFQAEGEEKINPLDGSPHGEHPLDDTWAVRSGIEYLLVFPRVEIPLRAGVAWEERPAIGEPDQYWSGSVGTGVALGKKPARWILDVAYVYTRGDDVLGSLVPAENLRTDVTEHQVFVSCIKHF
ncbi:MAG: hypothetical protein KA248_03565 [Kiritimatiellae bacterium]|nr:hypothetical protein [Kiritimatiellia bacterium]